MGFELEHELRNIDEAALGEALHGIAGRMESDAEREEVNDSLEEMFPNLSFLVEVAVHYGDLGADEGEYSPLERARFIDGMSQGANMVLCALKAYIDTQNMKSITGIKSVES